MLVPFSLRLTSPRRLMLLSLADDPVYRDLEVQWVDEPDVGGTGLVLLAVRRAGGATDVHVDSRLRVPRADYEVAGGVRAYVPTPMSPARFEVDEAGLDVELGTTLADGRRLELRVRESRHSPRATVDMLAPAGHSMRSPRFFPFFWMGQIGFLRWPGANVDVQVDGHRRRVVRAGLPWLLTRYATAPMTALWNEASDGPVPACDGDELAAVQVERDGHRLSIDHDPPFPDVATVRPGAQVAGRVAAAVDGRPQFGGRYWAVRDADTVWVGIDVDQPWDPGPQPWPAAAVFATLRVFRTWPTTYRWRATLTLDGPAPTMRAGWSRTSSR